MSADSIAISVPPPMADIGLHERRSIIDAIADHCDLPISLKPSHDARFVLRQYAGVHFVDANFVSDPPCRTLVVASQQHHRSGIDS